MQKKPFAHELNKVLLEGYGLTTAQILYWLPDNPKIIAPAFVWQFHDIAPKFPELKKFLDFWRSEIDGKLHSVTISHSPLIRAREFVYVNSVYEIN